MAHSSSFVVIFHCGSLIRIKISFYLLTFSLSICSIPLAGVLSQGYLPWPLKRKVEIYNDIRNGLYDCKCQNHKLKESQSSKCLCWNQIFNHGLSKSWWRHLWFHVKSDIRCFIWSESDLSIENDSNSDLESLNNEDTV